MAFPPAPGQAARMERPWRAQHRIDAETAAARIAARFPDLASADVLPLAEGWDNTAFLVGGEWVFRFPRRDVAAPLLEVECAVLPAIAGRLPLAVPVPERVAGPGAGFPYPFAGYRRLAGETACRAGLAEAARVRCAEPLARFLAALHAIPAEEARALGVPPDRLRRLDVAWRVRRARERLEDARRVGGAPGEGLLDAVIADLPASWEPRSDTLVHGDLYARHVLVDGRGDPCGVIDWGDVHVGDPAVDLALAWSFLPAAGRERFRAAYGRIDEDRWRVARLRALCSALNTLVYGLDTGDEALVRESRASLRHVAGA